MPDVGQKYDSPWKEDPLPEEPHRRKSNEDTTFLCEGEPQQEAAGRSPLTDELLAPGEDVTSILDYEENPEVMSAIANIPHMDDVKMQDVNPPLGFDPEVGWTRYNHNLVQASGEGALGSNSLVTEREDRMLDESDQLKAPEMDDQVPMGTLADPSPTGSKLLQVC